MNYLTAWLLVGLTMMVFLGILSRFESGDNGGGKVSRGSITAAVRDLLHGRRTS